MRTTFGIGASSKISVSLNLQLLASKDRRYSIKRKKLVTEEQRLCEQQIRGDNLPTQ